MEKLIAGCYFERAVKDPATLVSKIERHMRDKRVDFDTFVVTGISGAILGPLAAFAMGKNLLFVRKGESCHSARQVAGSLGRRWVFLDDFMESGETLRRCIQRVREFTEYENHCDGTEFASEFVGRILYGEGRLDGENPANWAAWADAGYIFEIYQDKLHEEIKLMRKP